MSDITVFETLPEGAEVYKTSASTVEIAAVLGITVAAAWTSRGFPSECIGVTPHEANVETRTFDGNPPSVIARSGFRPVIVAKT